MLPPFFCSPSTDMDGMKRQHQQRKHAMLSMWRDGVERQLSALNAAIDTLEKQMNRTSNQTDWSDFKRSLRVANARFRRRWTVMAETPMVLLANLILFPSKITKRMVFWSFLFSFCKPLFFYSDLFSSFNISQSVTLSCHKLIIKLNQCYFVPAAQLD